ncbi:hypothetical protein Tco_1559118, partial [Tanacetum coccineum]
MYTQPQLQTQHPGMFMELLKSDYPIQQLQQSYRGDILRKRPHDDHQDNHQHEGEKVKRLRTTHNFTSMPTSNTNIEEILESKTAQIDKETSQDPSTARNEVPHEDKAEVPQEFMG